MIDLFKSGHHWKGQGDLPALSRTFVSTEGQKKGLRAADNFSSAVSDASNSFAWLFLTRQRGCRSKLVVRSIDTVTTFFAMRHLRL